jgi:hypothetical protein
MLTPIGSSHKPLMISPGWGGLTIFIIVQSSVVILVIHYLGITCGKTKGDAEVIYGSGLLQLGQDQPDTGGMLWVDARLSASSVLSARLLVGRLRAIIVRYERSGDPAAGQPTHRVAATSEVYRS